MRRSLIAVAAGLALADASIVALALPEILLELDTTVEGVAAVIGVYTAVLALALLPAERLRRAIGDDRLGAGGLALFAVASAGCGLTDSLAPLLVLRAMQAVGGAAALVAAFDAVDGSGEGRRMWVAAAVFGTAVGPALGGILTELFDWRAIFFAQVPLALAAGVAFVAGPAPAGGAEASGVSRQASETRFVAALALLSAGLVAVLFLLVLILIAGFSVSPIAAAVAVMVLPVTAILASRIPGHGRVRAAAGCLLLAGGVAALAFLPGSSPWWTVPPQLLAGLGMGLALPSLAGELLPERSPGEAARLLTIRHAGIAVALVLLAPLASSDLDNSIEVARERGTAIVLDAELDPTEKLDLAPALLVGIETEDPRDALADAVAEQSAEDEDEYDRVAERLDDTVVEAVISGFDAAFLLTAGFCLIAGVLLFTPAVAVIAAAVVALALPPVYAALESAVGPEEVVIADPCDERDLPDTGGLEGFAQDLALRAVDAAACRYGSSREELVLALADDDLAKEYEREHGVNPQSVPDILESIF
jgi:predicted MFS family arabinose efflux permease